MNTILIQDGLLVEPGRSWRADLLIEDDKIARIEPYIDPQTLPADTEVVKADGLCVLPGLIDAHTHYALESRGTVTADGFAEGSKLAAFGGVTTVIDFADHDKGRSLAENARERIDAMQEGMAIDFALHQGVYGITGNMRSQLTELKETGVTAVKIFTTYKHEGYLIDSSGLAELFSLCRELGLLVTVHAEDDDLITDTARMHRGTYGPADHPDLRPSEAEYRAIKQVGALAKEARMPLYVVHLSSARGMDAVRELRREGVTAIVETTPHYLLLTRQKLEGPEGALCVMTPPLRDKYDNRVLQDALVAGELQVVATDHCAFSREQKLASDDCRTILPGIPGTEELLPLVHTFAVASGRMSISQLVDLLSTTPAKTFGLYPQKGSLAVGTDADIVLFDSDDPFTIDRQDLHTQALYSPYEGMRLVGRVVMTYVRGRLVMGDGVYLGRPGEGQFLKAGVPGPYRSETVDRA